jgi:hypothetical protein
MPAQYRCILNTKCQVDDLTAKARIPASEPSAVQACWIGWTELDAPPTPSLHTPLDIWQMVPGLGIAEDHLMMKMLHGIGGRYKTNSRREPCWQIQRKSQKYPSSIVIHQGKKGITGNL